MDDKARSDEDRALRLQLDLQLDRQPIRGRLRSARGGEQRFEGWLGFVDALERLRDDEPRDAATTDLEDR